jgi:hypothetical protein
MDVMVFCPVYRLEPQTVQALLALEPGEAAVTLVLQRDNPRRTDDARADGFHNHQHQYERGRELFLAGRYDAMLVVESDMIPPPDTLARLTALPCDVAFGCYAFRQGDHHVNIVERRDRWPAQVRSMGGVLTATEGLWQAAMAQGVIDCSGSGLGCTLIRRHVLEAAPFGGDPHGGFFDFGWTQTVATQGWRMMADCNLHCGHVDEDGTVLWPEVACD